MCILITGACSLLLTMALYIYIILQWLSWQIYYLCFTIFIWNSIYMNASSNHYARLSHLNDYWSAQSSPRDMHKGGIITINAIVYFTENINPTTNYHIHGTYDTGKHPLNISSFCIAITITWTYFCAVITFTWTYFCVYITLRDCISV